MNSNTPRLIALFLATSVTISVGWAAPVPTPKPVPPMNFTGKELSFLKLQGVDRKKGVFTRSSPVTKTEYRPQVQQRTVTRLVQGKRVQEVVQVTVMVPVTKQIVAVLDTKTYDVYDGSGKLIPTDKVFDRLAEGQIVLVCSTSVLPRSYLRMLSPNAIILVPKRKRSSQKN